MKQWDTLIQNAKIFDGTGKRPWLGDIAIKDGTIAELGSELDPNNATDMVDGQGRWAIPGLLDIHTHYDLELELAPGLPESVRHGTTTVVIANCSIGLAYGNQRSKSDNIDPIVDCFARVENMPKHVLKKAADIADWSDSEDYLNHVDGLNLGPNVAALLPHSMLRIQAMGFTDSISRHPTKDEMQTMKDLVADAMQQGYVGLSTDALPFHYIAGDPYSKKKIPTQYAKYGEIKELTSIVREYDRVWQATPPKDNPLATIRLLLLTSGRLFKKTLRTTVVAAMDIKTNRMLAKLGLILAYALNSFVLKGRFALQALASPFKVWSEGAITPIGEEIPELRELNEPDLEDKAERLRILNDPGFQKRFKAMWNKGKHGFSIHRLRRLLRLEDFAISRSFEDMYIHECPVTNWKDLSFREIYNRLGTYLKDPAASFTEAERDVYASYDRLQSNLDEADFLLHLFRLFDTDLYWHTITANEDPATVRKLIMHPKLMPGFNDSGAHLTNMAFYDNNLRALRIAAESGRDEDVAYMVKRLTKDPAAFFNIDAGVLAEGARADIVLINPDILKDYDGEANIEYIYRDEFEHKQLVNRSEGVVDAVFIAGKSTWSKNGFTPGFGRRKFGRLLRPKDAAQNPAPVKAG